MCEARLIKKGNFSARKIIKEKEKRMKCYIVLCHITSPILFAFLRFSVRFFPVKNGNNYTKTCLFPVAPSVRRLGFMSSSKNTLKIRREHGQSEVMSVTVHLSPMPILFCSLWCGYDSCFTASMVGI